MSKCKRPLLVSAIVVILCMVIGASVVYAMHVEGAFTVGANSTMGDGVDLKDGDKFNGSISIKGGSRNDIIFWITNPQGDTILDFDHVSQGTSFEFTAQGSGYYDFVFRNDDTSSRVITFSYDGYPDLPVILSTTDMVIWNVLVVLLIGILASAGFGIYVSLRHSRNKPPNPPPS